VGGVTPRQAQVFIRVDQSADVQLRYSRDPSFSVFETTEVVQPNAATDFTAILALSGLRPRGIYYLDVLVDDVPQLSAPYPRFRTFPSDSMGPQNFRFVVLTDFDNKRAYPQPTVPTFANAAAVNPAFAFIGGDFNHQNPKSLNGKRGMFKFLYDPLVEGREDFVELILKRTPIAHHWDDHDAGENNIDRTYPDWDLSYQAYNEYVPSYSFPGEAPGIWQRFRYAQVTFFVLDNRSQRDPATDPDDASKSMLDGNAIGDGGQLEWLKDGLTLATTPWKVVFTSLITNPTTKLTEGWAAYQTEWSALRSHLEENGVTGVVFLSGDLHSGGIDDGTAAGFPEMLIPSADGVSPDGGNCYTAGFPGDWSEGVYASDVDPCRGYGVVTVLTNPDRMRLEVRDEWGGLQLSHEIELD
jgi:alkaline phosphatase D